MSRPVALRPLPTPPVITLASRCSIGGSIRTVGAAAPSSGASPWSDAANCLLAFPFVLEAHSTTFYKGFWVNGSSVSNNSEVGIWDESYNKIVTTGSIGNSGGNVPQSNAFASSATPTLPPGLYYAGMASNTTTTNRYFRWSSGTSGNWWQAMGCWRQSGITLGSLAATATPGDMSNLAFPLFGLITRSSYDV